MTRVPLLVPHLEDNVRGRLDECLATNYVSSVGPFVERFEEEFARLVGSRCAVACASGTAALHLAMRLVGVSPGDEVWLPSLTFVASANPIAYERGTPVFVDSERETWNLDPAIAIAEIRRRARAGVRQPRAIEVVHVLGHPARIDELEAEATAHGIPLIEDAAEALGARYATGRFAGRSVGTVGLLGCFSFNGNKVITTGGGGMLTTDDPVLARRARHLATQARMPGIAVRHDEVGYNYRLTNLAAAVGLAQLESLPRFLAAKRAIADRYDDALAPLGVRLPPRAAWAAPSHWLYSILLDGARPGARDATIAALGEAGIESRPLWDPLHTLGIHGAAPRLGTGAVAESLASAGLSLPSSVGLSSDDQERVVATLASVSRPSATTET